MTDPKLPSLLPIDLQHFLNAVLAAAKTAGGFGLDEVARVDEAWEITDSVLSSNGYVVALADGRRVYLEYTMDDMGAGTVEAIEIVPLAAGMERPDLAETAHGVCWYRPDHLNDYLAAQRAGSAARH